MIWEYDAKWEARPYMTYKIAINAIRHHDQIKNAYLKNWTMLNHAWMSPCQSGLIDGLAQDGYLSL